MNAVFSTLASLVTAYLIGSIPSGLLIARWFGRVDIRTVGSGNIGATNVGRVLGFRFFVVVFLLDFLKGYLPTRYLPGFVTRASGFGQSDVLIAVAAILGHNFPIFLKFRGGKGVATSLGAVFALDPVASVCSATGFVVSLLVTRYVSMSSILGGLVWLIAHFARVPQPLARDQIAMTIAMLGLMGLLVVRHRKNLARIGAGTEPKVNFRKKKRPEGRVATLLVAALAVVAIAGGFAANAGRKFEVIAGPYRITEVARVATGHQRAERLAFADGGKLLAVTCPRYGRAMLYRVTETEALELVQDVDLEGRPVALATTAGRIHVLVRPNNDARHVEEGWCQTFDFPGKPVGPKTLVGFYPDDLAITPDGRHALILTSGRGEGGDHRPRPALTVYELDHPGKPVGRLEFDEPGDDPSRLAVSNDATTAAVSIQGTNAIAWIDLADLAKPKLIGRRWWGKRSTPDSLRFDRSGGVIAVDESEQALWYQASPTRDPERTPVEGGVGEAIEIPGTPKLWAFSIPFGSGVGFMSTSHVLGEPDHSPSILPLKGRANLTSTRPLGLAFDENRGLLAVANRSGGSVHLIRLAKGEPAP